MEKIIAKNVNKKMFMNLIKQMIVVDRYVTLRIGDEKTDSTSYTPMHDVVKNMVIDNSALFESIDEHKKPIRISFADGIKFNSIFNYFNDDEEFDLIIRCDDDDSSDELTAIQVTAKNDRLTRSGKCADPNFAQISITPLEDEKVDALFSTDDSVFKFGISTDMMMKIRPLTSIEKTIKKFIYKVSDGKLSICERPDMEVEDDVVYDMKLDTLEDVDDCEYVCNKNIWQVMSLGDFDVDVCESRVIYVNSSEENVVVRVVTAIVQ